MTVENININVTTNAGTAASQIGSLASALRRVSDSATVNGLNGAAKATRNVGEAAKAATRHTGNFAKSLKRIAMYRMLRTIIKEITQAFSEGFKNAYLFSASIEGSGHRFAEAMDRINSAGTQLKSQLGSALISLLATVEPVLVQIINLAIRAADAMSQFFAAFTGSTYLKAAAVTDTLVDDFQSGAKAAKEWKNQLLGFDVINRLNAPSDTGAGGLTPSDLFGGEASPIDEKWKKLAELVKKFIPDLETLKRLAKEVALLFLAWKIGSAFGKNLQQVIGLALAAYSAFKFIEDILRTLDEGFTWDNLKDLLLDIAGLAAGAYLAFGRIGAGIALLVAGAALVVTAFKDMEKNGMNLINTLGMIAGLLTAGLGISILTKSWIPLAIAAIASLVVALVYAFGEGQNFTEGMRKIFDGLGKFFKNIFKGDIDEAMKGITLAWEGAKQVGLAVTNALRKAWQTFLDWIGDRLGPKWKQFFEGASKVVTDFVSNNILGLKGLVEFISGVFTGDWSKAWQGVKDVLAAEANHMLNIIGFFVNGFIDGVNGLIDGMNTISGKVPDWIEFANFVIPGVGSLLTSANNLKLSRIPSWTPPQFETGGWPDMGSLFIAQEKGPELVGSIGGHTAVANNDQIVEAVSSGVYEAVSSAMGSGNKNVSVHVYLDSREIKSGQQRLARAVGG